MCGRRDPEKNNNISGPVDDPSVQARLKGLQWLCTHGRSLPAGVERVLVMDTTDLQDLPLTNDDPNLPSGVDVEAFWKADGRMASRVLLRHGDNGECRSFSVFEGPGWDDIHICRDYV